ncbi:MAG TPA: NAD(P)/FAD-dependent oxidoreductase [Aquabacterium sp.]|nr:NAD(P)/FAD-dependent oxidoreductase [Aquabacterium sp.]
MIQTDAVVIGAGPVGLFQVFQLGLLGVRAHLIDVLPEPGGQCVALYPDKPIYDVPGIPVCSGRELTAQLLRQAAPFLRTQPGDGREINLHLGHLVEHLAQPAPGQFEVRTQQGLQIQCRAVFVAAGAGAFLPRGLNVPGLEGCANVHYQPLLGLRGDWHGQHVVIAGGSDEALKTALDLAALPDAQRPLQITLLHRRDQFQAELDVEAAFQVALGAGVVQLAIGMPTDAQIENGRAQSLTLLGPDSQPRPLTLDQLLVRQGMSPKLGPLTQWGLALERKQVPVSSSSFESPTPGIYAVGDINTYPGKKRLLLCGFHEATLAAHDAATALHPDAPQQLLYTTTSPLLHQRLGVLS